MLLTSLQRAAQLMLFSALGVPLAAGALEIEDVWPAYFDTADLQGVCEFFTGEETRVGAAMVRTDETTRDGLYFRVILDGNARELPTDTTARVQLISSLDKEPETFSFSIPADADGDMLWLGLTGEPWSDLEPSIVAWQVTLLAPDDQVIASHDSFLWDMP